MNVVQKRHAGALTRREPTDQRRARRMGVHQVVAFVVGLIATIRFTTRKSNRPRIGISTSGASIATSRAAGKAPRLDAHEPYFAAQVR